jgi:hypothetical protein
MMRKTEKETVREPKVEEREISLSKGCVFLMEFNSGIQSTKEGMVCSDMLHCVTLRQLVRSILYLHKQHLASDIDDDDDIL